MYSQNFEEWIKSISRFINLINRAKEEEIGKEFLRFLLTEGDKKKEEKGGWEE